MPIATSLTDLALAVDGRLTTMPAGCDPARLFAVLVRDDGELRLLPLWSGVARELPAWVVPPLGATAIALDAGGWAAPLDDGLGAGYRPSRHPQRRRVHHTCIVYGTGEEVSVLREGDGPPQVLTGATGRVLDLLVACWDRRRRRSAPS